MTATVALNTDDLADLSGLTERQVRLYCSVGVFGDANVAPGSGRARSFTPDDVVVGGALYRLAELFAVLTGQGQGLHHGLALRVADAVRGRSGLRWLVVHHDGSVLVSAFPPEPSAAFILVDLEDIS